MSQPRPDSPQSRVVWMPGDVRTEIQLTSEETNGALCLLVDEPPAGWSLPPHRHLHAAETILVLEGEFAMTLDGRDVRLGAGQSLHVPRGVVHAGGNVGERTGRRVVLFSPGGMERFFAETGAADRGADVDLGAVLAAAARHGWEFVRS